METRSPSGPSLSATGEGVSFRRPTHLPNRRDELVFSSVISFGRHWTCFFLHGAQGWPPSQRILGEIHCRGSVRCHRDESSRSDLTVTQACGRRPFGIELGTSLSPRRWQWL